MNFAYDHACMAEHGDSFHSPCYNESLSTIAEEAGVPWKTLCDTLKLDNCDNIDYDVAVPVPNSARV